MSVNLLPGLPGAGHGAYLALRLAEHEQSAVQIKKYRKTSQKSNR